MVSTQGVKVKVLSVLHQGEFVPPHYVNNIRLFTKKVVKRFRMMYVNGQVLLQSGG